MVPRRADESLPENTSTANQLKSIAGEKPDPEPNRTSGPHDIAPLRSFEKGIVHDTAPPTASSRRSAGPSGTSDLVRRCCPAGGETAAGSPT